MDRRTYKGILAILVSILMLVLALAAWAARNLQMTNFDARQDYVYAWAQGARIQSIKLDENLVWTVDSPINDATTLMAIRVDSHWLSYWMGPSVDMYLNEKYAGEQHFEVGARGVRYLNVTEVMRNARSGDQFRLVPHRMRILHEQSAEMLHVPDVSTDARKLMVISPHPDDAEIAAFGLYSSHDSVVVTLTAGEKGRSYYKAIVQNHPEELFYKGWVRVHNSISIPMMGNVPVEHAYNLGYFNGLLASMARAPEKHFPGIETRLDSIHPFRVLNKGQLPENDGRNSWNNLVADLTFLLNRHAPDVVVLPHPGLDSHPDHQYAALATLEALELSSLALEKMDFLLYTNHAIQAEVYPFGPRTAQVTLPPWFDAGSLFYGIKSFKLDDHMQIRKAIALEAMHDLRLVHLGAIEEGLGIPKRLYAILVSLVREAGNYGTDYHRRAVRPNELFFVKKIEHLRATVTGMKR